MMSSNMQKKNLNGLWIALAFLALIVITLLPSSPDLPVAGQRALAILAFAVILWVTEAVPYPVSAAMIIGLITLMLGLGPALDDPGNTMGTGNALKLALGGFSNSAVALVAAALFLATAMQVTNLHKRLALWILNLVGTKTKAIVAGAIIVSIVLAFFVPSATARAGAVVPILMGMVAAFGLAKDSRLAALLIITAVQAVSIWNIGIKTGAAQNMVTAGAVFLPAAGLVQNMNLTSEGVFGHYWLSTPNDDNYGFDFYFGVAVNAITYNDRSDGLSVRLAQDIRP